MLANRNVLFALIGAMAVGLGVLGYALYQERRSRPASRFPSVAAASKFKRNKFSAVFRFVP